MSSEEIGDYVATNITRPAQSHARRRRREHVRLAGRDARLARPGQAQQLRAHERRHHRGDQGAERASVGRTNRRPARGAGPGDHGRDHRPDPPVDARGVPPDPRARESRRLAAEARRRRARRDQLRELRARHQVQRQARRRHRDPARDRSERARHRQRDPQDARPARAVLSGGLRGRVPARHDAVRAQVDRRRRAHAAPRRSGSCSW